MSYPDPLSKKKKPKELSGSPMRGDFECHACGESVREAKLQPSGDLLWLCECGHVSEIKEFFK